MLTTVMHWWGEHLILATIFLPLLLAVLSPFIFSILKHHAPILMAVVLAAHGYVVWQHPTPIPLTAAFDIAPQLGVELLARMDWLSHMWAQWIVIIGALVTVYARFYDRQLGRGFYAQLMLFMSAMLGIVLADDFISLFIAWELTSISSYLLIAGNGQLVAQRPAALQAFIITALGGGAMLLALLMVHADIGVMSLSEWREMASAPLVYGGAIVALIIFAAATKSAQAPFHFWLPAAMVAPTPVSSYLHSATMVTAGVYLLSRVQPMLSSFELWSPILLYMGLATMAVSSLHILLTSQAKRLLAMTTLQLLGLMIVLVSTTPIISDDSVTYSWQHHALYKAGLFMMAGVLIHAFHSDDTRRWPSIWQRPWLITVPIIALIWASVGGVGSLGVVAKAIQSDTLHHFAAWVYPSIQLMLLIGCAGMMKLLGIWNVRLKAKELHTPLWRDVWLPLTAPLVLIIFSLSDYLPLNLKGWIMPTILFWGGMGLAYILQRVDATWRWPSLLQRFSPSQLFERFMKALEPSALRLTNWLHRGEIVSYMMMSLAFIGACMLLLVTPVLLDALPHLPLLRPSLTDAMVLMGLIIGIALMLASSHPLTIMIGLSIIGLSSTLLFMLYGAPDLAMTQILVDILFVIMLAIVLFRLPQEQLKESRTLQQKTVHVLIAVAFGVLISALTALVLLTPLPMHLSDFYHAHTIIGAQGRNIVNTIIVDFRGLDTMGEILVLALAALAVRALVVRSST